MPRILALICLLLVSLAARAGGLFDAGAWAPIILPVEPEIDELYAARSLADWCERVTGVRPETRYEAKGVRSPAPAIYIGRTAAARSAGIKVLAEEGDTARRVVVGQSVFLLGNNPGATRIAVGRFCEQHLGVFFAFPGELGADWRPRRQLGFPRPDEFRPDFRWRQLSGLNELSEDWAFSVGYGRAPDFSHGLYRIFDQKLFKQEPMLFPMVGGKPTVPKGDAVDPNPHLDNPRAPEIGAKYVREFFRQNPNAFSVPLGVNDTLKFDDSAESEGWYRERPVRTDYVFRFYNAVADSAWAPDGDRKGQRHAIGVLAYQQTLRAPTIKLRPSIFPWVCADRTAYGDPAFAAQDRANLAAWAKSGVRRFGVYDYLYGAEVASPRVNLAALIQSVHATYSAGARGWYAEAYPLWAFDAPKLWVAAKLLEDRLANTGNLRRTWFDRAYGPAADELIGAYAQIEAAWKRDAIAGGKDQFLRHFHDQRGALVLSAEEIAAVSRHLTRAQQILLDPTNDAAARRRQAWRLGQFAEAWDLYLGYRELVQARKVIPSAEARLAALSRLTKAESGYLAKEAGFNRRWGAYGQPVKWSWYPGENPRAQWSERFLVEGADATIATWAATDQPKGWLAYRVAQQAEAAVVAHRHDFAVAVTAIETAPSSFNRTDRLSSGLRLIAPAGKVGPVVAPVALKGGQLVRLQLWSWTDDLPVAESQQVVTLRFLGPNARSEVTQVCQSRQTVLPAIVPAWATGLEYEITFTGGAFPQEASVQLIDLPASAAR
jgi:hypothetical protein